MEKDSKILIIAIFIIFIIAFVTINFNDLTGEAIKQQKTMSITISSDIDKINDIARAGNNIYVTIEPSNIIYHKSIRIFNSEDKQVGRFDMRFCSIYCHKKESASYLLPFGLEPGVYYLKIFDHTNQEFVKAYFTIV